MGDLEVFGLPSLLQSFTDSGVTGTLTLKTTKGDPYATVSIIKGKFRTAQYGIVSGESAFYQLFEKQQPGGFQFSRSLEPIRGSEADLQELLPLMLEAMRRHDEVQQYKSLIPDDTRLRAKAQKPLPLQGERDGLLFRDLWLAVQNGATPIDCEASIAHDSYRIRRLLSHWLESGIIETA